MNTLRPANPPPPSTPILVDSREAARLLSISPRTLWDLTNVGQVPCVKIGRAVRYRVSDLEAWARRQASGSVGGVREGEE